MISSMMTEPIQHPVFTGVALSHRERLKSGRRYGKYDFDKFKHLEGSRYSLGKGNIGEMEVACNFLFTKSKWGVLTPARNPGGVVYLDLCFTEPPGCSLKGATVLLSLNEDDKDLQRHFAAGKPPPKPRIPVHITEHGPQALRGAMSERAEIKKISGTPYIDVGGFAGVGGMGVNYEQLRSKRSQWRVASQPIPNHLGRATTLRWDIRENEFDSQPTHPNRFHTAFSFEHDGQPFFMQVEISGELESTIEQSKYKVKQSLKKYFKFPAEPRRATTMVNFGGRRNAHQSPLDELVETIPADMILANWKEALLVPEMQPAGQNLQQGQKDFRVGVTGIQAGDAVDLSESQTEQPYPAHLLPPARMADLRTEALSVISLGESVLADPLPTAPDRTQTQAQATWDINSDDSAGDSSDGASKPPIIVDADLIPPIDQSQHISDQGNVPKLSAAQDARVQKLLEESNLPLLIQLFIVWLLSFGTKPSSETNQTGDSVLQNP
jgi:hypothetical protein